MQQRNGCDSQLDFQQDSVSNPTSLAKQSRDLELILESNPEHHVLRTRWVVIIRRCDQYWTDNVPESLLWDRLGRFKTNLILFAFELAGALRLRRGVTES